MANQYFNFSYDPAKQGFDNSTWRTVYGDVAVVSGQLELTKAAIIHYADILRGDAVFSIDVPAPAFGDHTKFGFIQYSKGVHAYFIIHDTALTAETSDGVTTSSVSITWDAAWTNTNTEFRIKWEAGLVTFYVAGVRKAEIACTTLLDIPQTVVPNDPMSLYVESDAASPFLLNYIIVKSIQSYLMSEGNSDSSFEILVKEYEKMTISEAITMSISNPGINVSDSITISENFSKIPPAPVVNNSDQLTISESVTVFKDILDILPVGDDLTISEEVTTFKDILDILPVGDDITISEDNVTDSPA